jgi:hypothetical protein
MVIAQNEESVKTIKWDSYKEFMEHYLFEDGAVCGKKEEYMQREEGEE